jgi:hypothetical protein
MFLLPILFSHFPLLLEALFFFFKNLKGCTTCDDVIVKYEEILEI